MIHDNLSPLSPPRHPTDDLTPVRAFRIVLLSIVVWAGVALFIRVSGPAGVFAPRRSTLLFPTTFPFQRSVVGG
jgi:hypothetical protein